MNNSVTTDIDRLQNCDIFKDMNTTYHYKNSMKTANKSILLEFISLNNF
jgi:hypothetical protein